MSRDYTTEFYETIADSSMRSAAVILPLVLERYFHERNTSELSAIDVGCGEGWWARAFADHGAEVLGIDGGYVVDPAVPFEPVDISEPFDIGRTFDLAVCLEVAEHLPEASAAHLVAELVRLAPVVVFSAAMPRQGGTGHINCQPPSYWAELFFEHGYVCSDEFRFFFWEDPQVEPWYKSNTLLFSDKALPGTGAWSHGHARHVIHPDLWLDPR